MQFINLNKAIEFKENIQDLLLISIDDKLDTIEDKEGIRITGKVTIGGNTLTIKGEESFSDNIDIDIFLSYEEIEERANLKVMVNDFNYKIENNKLHLDITLSIEGLKEIIQTFLSQEDNEFVDEEEIIEEDIEEKEVEEDRQKVIEEQDQEIKEDSIEGIKTEEIIEEVNETQKVEEEIIEKKSLLKSVFSNKRIKEEVSWRLHCVKNEKNYEEIAQRYNIDLNKLISINKNEKIEEGKLIFLPLE